MGTGFAQKTWRRRKQHPTKKPKRKEKKGEEKEKEMMLKKTCFKGVSKREATEIKKVICLKETKTFN